MGLLQVGADAAQSVLGDQWREYFYCPSLDVDVLVKKGEKRHTARGGNLKANDNIITNGSIVAVNEGQCMIIVDQGEIVEICAEAGDFVYDSSSEPTLFYGDLKQSIIESFKTFGKRFTFGAETAKDQRVYFFNTKNIIGNKYGTATPVPFRLIDRNIGMDMDISIRCYGEYVFRITDPILFYKNLCANVVDEYRRDEIESQLKSEVLSALQPAFGRISEMGIRYSALPLHTPELSKVMDEELSVKWGEIYGISIISFAVSSVSIPKEDEDMIKGLQRSAVLGNVNIAAGHLVGAQAEAMKSAAENSSAGPMMAFAGMNMAGNAGGVNAQSLFAMGQQQAANQPAPAQQPQAAPSVAAPSAEAPAAQGWTCDCGQTGNTGKFCMQCGKPRPEADHWTCSCGAANKGKFCAECGKPKPAGVPQYKCDKCGWEPADKSKPPKFCPECGDPFDDGDITP